MDKPYSYTLPPEKIAQRPVYPYDSAKLLLVENNTISESTFSEIGNFLSDQDLLVFNDTAVFPARLFAQLETGAKVEVLLVEKVEDGVWECLARPKKKLKTGKQIIFENNLKGEVLENENRLLIKFFGSREKIFSAGIMPIPPYIRNGRADEKDLQDYQTCFAEKTGSIAAPTASLHFTPELFDSLEKKGVGKTFLTLHVGTHSFLPLYKHDSLEGGEEEIMREPGVESYSIEPTVWNAILEHKQNGGRVIAVGTTAVRALESRALGVEQDKTELFIKPGFEYKVIDGMITNFHQPETSHLLLVEAFMGKKMLTESYSYALDHDFRFLSYGDGMLILNS